MSADLTPLVGKYTLTRVNGKAPETPRPATLELEAFPDSKSKLRVHAWVANMLNGGMALEDGKLKGSLLSTRMMGAPGQMTVERLLGSGLMEGMEYTLENKVLTMTGKTGSLEWTVDAK